MKHLIQNLFSQTSQSIQMVNTRSQQQAENESTHDSNFAANGGVGPDGFRTPFPVQTNTPVSNAAANSSTGNQPIPIPVVPLREFFEIVEKEARKICDGPRYSNVEREV